MIWFQYQDKQGTSILTLNIPTEIFKQFLKGENPQDLFNGYTLEELIKKDPTIIINNLYYNLANERDIPLFHYFVFYTDKYDLYNNLEKMNRIPFSDVKGFLDYVPDNYIEEYDISKLLIVSKEYQDIYGKRTDNIKSFEKEKKDTRCKKDIELEK